MVNSIIFHLRRLNERRLLLLLLGITLGLRLYYVLMAQGIAHDSASYGFMARDFLRGDFLKGLSPAFHPLYPYLVALFSPSAASVEITGRLISLFFGTFTLIPVYYLVKEVLGQREAVFSALFYCFHPYLATYSGMLLSEATYWGFLTLSICFFWFAMTRGKLYQSMIAGVLLGLAYLTRPEGMGYLVVFLIWIIIYGGVKKNWFRKTVLMAGLMGAFLIPSVPYLMFIHQETGQWLISKKAMEAQPWSVKWSEKQTGKLKTKAAQKSGPTGRSLDFRRVLGRFIRNLPLVVYHYLYAYHFTLLVFLIFGLNRMRRERIEIRGFFTSLVLFHLLSVATITSSTIRFSVPLIPISLLWAGAGVVEIQRFLEKRNVPRREIKLFFLIVLIVLIQLPRVLTPERWERQDQKHVGKWLEKNTPEGAVIMSDSPQEVFYANRSFIELPRDVSDPGNPGKAYWKVIDIARENGVRYIMIDKNARKLNAGFVDSIESSLDLRELYKYQDKDGDMTVVYEVFD